MRYTVLAACIAGQRSGSPKSVLDLGCGSGILRERLPEHVVERYTGIDWSDEAVEEAQQMGHERSAFVAASIDEWEPDRTYDAIVFNEVLYYLPHPAATVERYLRWLTGGGSVFVSMWHPAFFVSLRRPTSLKVVRARRGYARIWSALGQRCEIIADILVRGDRLRTWRIQELQPRGGSLAEPTRRSLSYPKQP